MTTTESQLYSITKNKKPFDWHKHLQKESYTKSEAITASLLVGSWETCAVANQPNIIPRTKQGVPVDKELKSLGQRFGLIILAMEVEIKNNSITETYTYRQKAYQTLIDIEKRSAEIINQLQNKKS